jgi:predicted metal-binding protein
MSDFAKYVSLAQDLKMVEAKLITPEEIFFDIRALLKCRWGCEDFQQQSVRCQVRDTTYQERLAMVRQYRHILMVHGHEARELSKAVLEIERTAFLDGCYFAFAIRCCNLCHVCVAQQGNPCPTPEKVRPCDQSFGINVYQTARHLGWPCEVLQSRDAIPNRYGFVLLD